MPKLVLVIYALVMLLLKNSNNSAAQASSRLPPPQEPRAVLRLVSPHPNSIVTSDNLDLFFDVSGVEISSEKFRVIVLLNGDRRQILDHVLKPASFTHLQPGSHLLRAFIVSQRGAILRSPEAQVFTLIHIHFKDDDYFPLEKPLLSVASPEGTFNFEDARLILFDFTTKNFTLGDRGLKLRYTLGNITGTLAQNSPVIFTDLPPGEYVLNAQVITEQGVPLQGPFLSATCRFKILEPKLAHDLGQSSEQIIPRAIPVHEIEVSSTPHLRTQIIQPAPGLTILANDPAWDDFPVDTSSEQ